MSNTASGGSDERALVARFVAQREEAVFREIYRLHAAALHRSVLRLLGGRTAETEDALQETWLRALQGLASFRWESALGTWLTGIAVNCARERLRAAWRTRTEADEPSEAPAHEAPAPAFDAADVRALERAIERLPAGYRVVLVLHDVEGHTHDAVARMLGIEPGTSKSQLARARRALRRELAPLPRDIPQPETEETR